MRCIYFFECGEIGLGNQIALFLLTLFQQQACDSVLIEKRQKIIKVKNFGNATKRLSQNETLLYINNETPLWCSELRNNVFFPGNQ